MSGRAEADRGPLIKGMLSELHDKLHRWYQADHQGTPAAEVQKIVDLAILHQLLVLAAEREGMAAGIAGTTDLFGVAVEFAKAQLNGFQPPVALNEAGGRT